MQSAKRLSAVSAVRSVGLDFGGGPTAEPPLPSSLAIPVESPGMPAAAEVVFSTEPPQERRAPAAAAGTPIAEAAAAKPLAGRAAWFQSLSRAPKLLGAAAAAACPAAVAATGPAAAAKLRAVLTARSQSLPLAANLSEDAAAIAGRALGLDLVPAWSRPQPPGPACPARTAPGSRPAAATGAANAGASEVLLGEQKKKFKTRPVGSTVLKRRLAAGYMTPGQQQFLLHGERAFDVEVRANGKPKKIRAA